MYKLKINNRNTINYHVCTIILYYIVITNLVIYKLEKIDYAYANNTYITY